jgi:hypothetical protein
MSGQAKAKAREEDAGTQTISKQSDDEVEVEMGAVGRPCPRRVGPPVPLLWPVLAAAPPTTTLPAPKLLPSCSGASSN